MNGSSGFKRLNFFTGFFTNARDWNEGQDYHIEKRRLHNRSLHSPGVIKSERHELNVEPFVPEQGEDPPQNPVVRILPGAALI